MKKVLIIISLTGLFYQQGHCQADEKAGIKAAINTLFEGMRKGDTVLIRSVFSKDMILQSLGNKVDGSTALVNESADDFVKSIGKPHAQVYDERISFSDIKIDGPLASVWAPYKFYLGLTFSHCGVDAFQLMKTPQGWKIIYIVDTRRKDDCVE